MLIRAIRRRGFHCILLVLVTATSTSCAGANARQLSRETLAQTTEYENALHATSRVLAAHYQTSVAELEARIAIARQAELDARIHRAADDAVDRARLRGLVSQDFRAYVDEVVSADLAEATRSVNTLDHMRQQRKTLLDQMEAQEKRLKVIRTQLEVLQTEPGWRDRLTELAPYFEMARKLYEDQQSKAGATR